jgi:Ser/Thr protein kinase RdoA (MazF antagonist)
LVSSPPPAEATTPDQVFLTESDVIDRLVAAQVLCVDDIVDIGLTVETSTRRNRNLQITWPDGSGYFVKLPDDRSPMSRATLRAEAEFYRTTAGRGHPFDALLVRLVYADPDISLLTLELDSRHYSLRDLVTTIGPGEFPIALYRTVGRLLGEVHAAGPGASGAPASPPAVVPVANYGRPAPWLLGTASRGTLMLMEMLQDSEALSAGLTELVGQWQSETLVHGDIRADNVLVAAPAGGSRDVRLVDWELWHVGDPAQDLAGLLEAVVSATLGHALSDPPSQLADAKPSDQWLDLGTAGIVMQAACRAVWEEYLSARRLTPPARRALALRAAAFTAARMVQSELEVADRSEAVSTRGCAMLQVAENVFVDPERAATEFLALE